MLKRRFTIAAVLAVGSALAPIASHALVLETFTYRDGKSAATAWRAIDKSPQVRLSPTGQGLAFPCPFNEPIDRCYWDHDVRMDLSRYTSFDLELACDEPTAFRSVALYLRSGNGWYVWNKPLREAGRQHVLINKDDFSIEGKPSGWHRIDRIRISPWKGSALSTTLTLHSLTARRDTLVLVQATLSSPDAGERAYAERTTQRVSKWLNNMGVSHTIITDQDVVRGSLANAGLAVLPYNPNPPPAMLAKLKQFLDHGGKLLVCYSSSPELAQLMHVKLGDYMKSDDPARWNAMVFTRPAELHTPARVYQSSGNIRPIFPAGKDGWVAAYWANAQGNTSGDPAWVATDRGFWMSHVLLDDDVRNKQRMLLGLMASCSSAIWREGAQRAMGSVGKIDSYPGLREAAASIRTMAAGMPDEAKIVRLLARADDQRNTMTAQFNSSRFADALDTSYAIQHDLIEAYALAQRPRAGEFRGVWDHDGVGWYPGNWDRSCKILASSGITAIFPNVLWTGLAHYPSKIVPASNTLKRYGDQAAECVAAAHKNGLQVHAWKICWNIEQAPDDFKARMKKEGRLLKSSDGKSLPWLDPSQPANVALELAAIKELVSNYDVDGLHLDYIRFPPGADRRLKKPEIITKFVRQVRDAIKAIRPGVKLSAAVWGGYPDTISSIGQDWGRWLNEGLVDFVCPMNYTEDRYRFSSLLEGQLRLANSKGRIYPGLGVTAAESQLQPDQVIEQISILRRLGANGFMLFDLSNTLREDTLPALSHGATRR